MFSQRTHFFLGPNGPPEGQPSTDIIKSRTLICESLDNTLHNSLIASSFLGNKLQSNTKFKFWLGPKLTCHHLRYYPVPPANCIEIYSLNKVHLSPRFLCKSWWKRQFWVGTCMGPLWNWSTTSLLGDHGIQTTSKIFSGCWRGEGPIYKLGPTWISRLQLWDLTRLYVGRSAGENHPRPQILVLLETHASRTYYSQGICFFFFGTYKSTYLHALAQSSKLPFPWRVDRYIVMSNCICLS